MNILFRADASIHIGSGHVMRCLVLAKILRNRGHQVTFATRPQKGDFVDYIKQQKIPRAIGTGDFLILSFCKEVIE